MDDVSVILLSLDADTTITKVSCIAVVNADSLCYQAQKRVQAAFDTKGASFVFFVSSMPFIRQVSVLNSPDAKLAW